MAANVKFEGREDEDEEGKMGIEQAALMRDMLGLIESPGYKVLHRTMVAELEQAQRTINDLRAGLDVIRYNQGIVAVVNRLRTLVIDMTKEEFYVGKRHE